MGCINEPIGSELSKSRLKNDKTHIDQNKLSRQLAVYGHEAQGKLMAMKVFLYGITGLGLEVAKNLILAGPKQVRIYDEQIVRLSDLGTHFYAKQQHIGKKTRAQAALSELKDLNPNATIELAESKHIQYIVQHFTFVVVLDIYDKEYLVNLNKACREKNIGFIYAGNLGLYGFTFVDLGDNHKVSDQTGEQEKLIHISGISKDEVGLVYLHQDKKHGLNDGDTVVFRQVKGMQELNGKSFKIIVKSPDSFAIGDTSKFSDYVGGGIANEVKVPALVKFFPLQKSFENPYPPGSKQMPICNWEKFGLPEQLHIILNGVINYWGQHKRLPNNLNKQDSKELFRFVLQHQSWVNSRKSTPQQQFTVNQIDPKMIDSVSLYCQTQVSPICSFWGGIITQQIVKFTGKYSPLRQWLHHQFFQILPEKEVKRSFLNTRYADYNTLFGDQFLNTTMNSSSFLVGAGALGCQFIKMFALMGLGSQGKGRIVCTDDDNIQISNLNRQFLFRKQHVGKNKSEIACHVGKKINGKAKCQSVKLKVSPDTEDYFNDQFWTSLDFVVNAVDNIKARQYVDTQCVWYEKPLFQSGTLGTKCHSQIIIPHKTISYTDIVDPPQQTIPLCTLKNFPYQIQHTIQWARDYFEGTITEPSHNLKKFYENQRKFVNQVIVQNKQNPSTARFKLETLRKLYECNQSQSYRGCVQLAVNIFWDVFHNQIAQLLNAFPQNHVNQQTKKPFWSGLKRAPKAIHLDLNDPLQLQVIQAGANIFAVMFNIPMQDNKNLIKNLAKSITPHKFVPKKVKIEVDEKEKEKQNPIQANQEDEIELKKLQAFLVDCSVNKSKSPTIVEFEKDDPTNWHIEFMGGVSNLRARNYRIQEVDNFKVKLIAGKIIPAIATTTAMVVGAVGIQIVKTLMKKPIESFKNMTANLALPLWVFNDPSPAIQMVDKQFDPIMCGPIKAIPSKFTKWDKIDIKGPLTIEQLKKKIEKDYKIQVSMITYGSLTIYSAYNAQESQKRLKMKIQEAIESLSKKQLPKWRKILPLSASGNVQDGTDCVMPDVRYHI